MPNQQASQPANQSIPEISGAFFDYGAVKGYEKSYAAQYYLERDITEDVKVTNRFFLPRLLQNGFRSSYCEVGCGPTVHNALMLAPFASRIVLSDYLSGNLEQVSKWVQNAPDAYPWSAYTKFLLELEGKEAGAAAVQVRERETREKIQDVTFCDLMQPFPLPGRETFDLVGCFHCLEAVARNSEGLMTLMKNVANLVAPGGVLMVAMLSATEFYHVVGADGKAVDIPCLMGDAEMVANAAKAAGFEVRPDDVSTTPVEGQADEGVTALIHLWATMAREKS